MALWSWNYCHFAPYESDSVHWHIRESLLKFAPLIPKITFQVEDYRKYNGLWELCTQCIWTDNPYFWVLRRGRQSGTVWIHADKLFDIHYTRNSSRETASRWKARLHFKVHAHKTPTLKKDYRWGIREQTDAWFVMLLTTSIRNINLTDYC